MLDRLTIERMRALAEDRPIAVAVSGGGDSLALLHLLAETFEASRLRALIVDHALRQGSRADALAACEQAQAAGVVSELLTLNWGDVASAKSQQAARRARYKILFAAAQRAGANLIALGHTADDQAETVLMRAASGSGWRGLAGMAAMAPAPIWPEGLGLALARPLLGVRRSALRRYLEDRAARWIEDPANANVAFERVRTRARIAELESAGFDPLRLTRLAARLRERADALDDAVTALIVDAVRFEGPTIAIDAARWRGDGETRLRALAILTAAAAGAERLPDSDGLARLEIHMCDTGFRGATLGGVLFRHRKGEVRLQRDSGAVLGRAGGPPALAPLELPVGRETAWDGRAALTTAVPGLQATPGADGGVAIVAADGVAAAGAATVRWLVEAHVRHLLACR